MAAKASTITVGTLLLLASGTAWSATCTWSGGSGDWQDPLQWSDCGAGNGIPAGTPGPSDTAIINSAGDTISLIAPTAVAGLDLLAGTVNGPYSLFVDTLNWSGGSLGGDPGQSQPVDLVVRSGTLTGNRISTDRFLRTQAGGALVLQDGADLQILRNTPPGAPCGPMPFAELCITPGTTFAVDSTLADPSVITANIVNGGRFEVRALPSEARIAAGSVYIQAPDAVTALLGGELEQLGAGEVLGFAAGRVIGSGTLTAAGPIEFFAAEVDVGEAGLGTLNLSATDVQFRRNSRIVLDVLGIATLDRIIASAPVHVAGVVRVRSPLGASSDPYTLLSGTTMTQSVQAFENELFTHVLEVNGSNLRLVPSAGNRCLWTGLVNADFATAGNWSGCGGGIPGAGDLAVIDLASATVQVAANASVGRLKLAVANGGLNIGPGVQLSVVDAFKWVAGEINTGAGGQLHLNFGGYGSIGDSSNANDRQLNGLLVNGFNLAMGENFGITLGAGAQISNAADITFINTLAGPNRSLDGGQIINTGTLVLLEGADASGTVQINQTSGTGLLLVRGGHARFTMQGSQLGELRVESQGVLVLEGSGMSLDPAGRLLVSEGTLELRQPFDSAAEVVIQRLLVEASGPHNGALTLNMGSTPPVLGEVHLRGGASLDGSAVYTVDVLRLDEGTVAGDSLGGQTLVVHRLLSIEGSAATSLLIDRQVQVAPSAELVWTGDNTLELVGLAALDVQGQARVGAQAFGEVATLRASANVGFGGNLLIEDGRTLEFAGTFAPSFSGPSDQILLGFGATLRRSGDPLVLSGTVIRGHGVIEANVDLVGTVVKPGMADGTTGILQFLGDIYIDSGSDLDLELNGVVPGLQHDSVDVIGQLGLDSPSVSIVPIGPYNPLPADVFDVVTFSTLDNDAYTPFIAPAVSDTHELGYDIAPPMATKLQVKPLGGGGITVSISDASVLEGDSGTTTMSFTVTATGSGPATVDYTTNNGSAIAPGDYLPASGNLPLTGGNSSTINVSVVGDTDVEGVEFFSVTLSNCVGCTLSVNTAIGTINDDDGAVANCTWDGSNNSWESPANWLGCGTGTGNTPGTPGPSDRAIINSGTVNTLFPTEVAELVLSGGTLAGTEAVDINGTWIWSGGSLQTGVNLQAGATGTFNGGQKNLDGGNVFIAGDVVWSAGLINFTSFSVFNVEPTGTLEFTGTGPTEAIQGSGQFLLEGSLTKSGTAVLQIQSGVLAEGDGVLQLTNGEFQLRGLGTTNNWAWTVLPGTTLEWAGTGGYIFGLASSITGSGLLRIGDAGVQTTQTFRGTWNHTGSVELRSARMSWETPGGNVSVGNLALLHSAAVVDGDDNLTISGALHWQQGTIDGFGATPQMFLDGTADLTSGAQKFLLSRQLFNNGTLDLANQLFIGDGGELNNNGTLNVNIAGAAQILGTGAAPRIVRNQGGGQFNKSGTGILEIGSTTAGQEIDYANLAGGQLSVLDGSLNLFNGGTDGGDQFIAMGATLRTGGSAAVRTFNGPLSGSGTLQVADASLTNVRGFASLGKLRVDGSAIADIDSTGAISNFTELELFGGTLQGLDDIHATTLIWNNTVIVGAGNPRLYVSGTGNIDAPGSLQLTGRRLETDGVLTWAGGNIVLANNAQLNVLAGGELRLAPISALTYTLSCSAICATAGIFNDGTIDTGGALGATYTLAPSVNLSNNGVLRIDLNEVQIDGTFSTGAGSIVEVTGTGILSGAVNGTSTLAVTQGVVRGNGTLDTGLSLAAGTTLNPNSGGVADDAVTLTINGNLDHSAGGVLRINANGIGAGQFDQIQVLGNVVPGPVEPVGTLAAGSSVTFANYTSRSGPYASLTGAQAADFTLGNPTATTSSLTRVVLGTAIVVDRTDDPVSPIPADEACTAAANDCTLAGAIKLANSQAGPDVIAFDVPGAPSTVHTITLNQPLPALSEAVHIDGYTQGDASPNTQASGGLDHVIRVVIDGSVLTPLVSPDSVAFELAASGIIISGLSLVEFEDTLLVEGNGALIVGNAIGMYPDGVTPSTLCGTGVIVTGPLSFIGGPTPADRNLIAGCSIGISVEDDALDVFIDGNLIGTTQAGNALVNANLGTGIAVRPVCTGLPTPSVQIGSPGVGNLIAGRSFGVHVLSPFGTTGAAPCAEPAGVFLLGNRIGAGFGGAAESLPNVVGVRYEHTLGVASLGVVRLGDGGDAASANLIANNSSAGVRVAENATGLRVDRNDIVANGGVNVGIDLLATAAPGEVGLPTPNDPQDADEAANRLQNFPLITDVVTGPGTVDITFSVDTLPANADYGIDGLDVDFYVNAQGEAARWIGRTQYSDIDHGGGATPLSKTVNFADTLAPDDEIVAIATDSENNSSEFSFVATVLTLNPPNPDPATVGSSRLITGTVASAQGEPFTLDGVLGIDDGTDSCGAVPLTHSGTPGIYTFSCSLPTTGAVGARTITASFTALDPFYRSSGDTVASTVNPGGLQPSATSIVAITPTPANVGVTYSLAVEVTGNGGQPPGGTVTLQAAAPFAADTCVLTLVPQSLTLSNGNCTITSATPGVRQYTATYGGDTNLLGSTSTPQAQVVRTTAVFPAGGVTQSAAQTTVGEPFDVNVTVRGGDGIPVGNVTVLPQPFGVAQNCTLAPIGGNDAACQVSVVAPVALGKLLRVTYAGSGDGVYPPASTTLVHDTLRAATSTQITANTPDPSAIDQPVTVQFSVTAPAGAVSSFAPLNGNVEVSDGLHSCTGTLLAITSGTAASGSCMLSFSIGGNRSLVARYQTSENFAGSVSPAVIHTVSGGAAGVDLAASLRNDQRVLNGGSTVTYTLEINNLGGSGVGGARVSNDQPAQLSGVTWTCVPTLPSQCPPSGSGDIDHLVDLVGGGRVTFRITGTVDTTESEVINTATVTTPIGVTDIQPANNTAVDRDWIGVYGDGFEAPGLD